MNPTAKGLGLAEILIGAQLALDGVSGNKRQIVERVAALLKAAKIQLDGGGEISPLDVRRLNDALDEIPQ